MKGMRVKKDTTKNDALRVSSSVEIIFKCCFVFILFPYLKEMHQACAVTSFSALLYTVQHQLALTAYTEPSVQCLKHIKSKCKGNKIVPMKISLSFSK